MYNPEDKSYEATVFLPLNNSLDDYSGNNLHAKDAGVDVTQFIKDPDRGHCLPSSLLRHTQYCRWIRRSTLVLLISALASGSGSIH